MYRSLLVPLDGSATAEQALPLALNIARRASAALELVSVQVPFPAVYGEDMARLENPLAAEAQQKARSYLDGLTRRIAANSSVPTTATLLEGSIADSISQHAAGKGADLVVMTVFGAGPWTRFWLGSVADQLVRKLPMAIVMLWPHERAPELSSEPSFKQILIPLDGSAEAEEAVEPAVELGTLMQAEFTLLRVVKPVVPLAASQPNSQRESAESQTQVTGQVLPADAQAYLDRVAERIRAKSLRVKTRVVLHENPAVAILDAQAQGVDLTAFTTRGHRALPWLFLGSTADKVLRGTNTPVLVKRPHQVQETAVRLDSPAG